MHNHHAVPSTYHQCIKYPLPSPKKEGTIVADNDPFGEVEAYYADARFYTKTSQRKGKDVKKSEDTPNVKDALESISVSTKRTFRYVPRFQAVGVTDTVTAKDSSRWGDGHSHCQGFKPLG
ncbi:unnamed protein product [Camellia sinensis]